MFLLQVSLIIDSRFKKMLCDDQNEQDKIKTIVIHLKQLHKNNKFDFLIAYRKATLTINKTSK